MSRVDVGQMLDGMAANSSERLNWKTSIADLLKLLQIDSSLVARDDEAALCRRHHDSASITSGRIGRS